MKKVRVHFIDKGQDLTHLDVIIEDLTGVIVATPNWCSSYKRIYVGKIICPSSLKPGEFFRFIDPKKDPMETETVFTIDRLEDITKTKPHENTTER